MTNWCLQTNGYEAMGLIFFHCCCNLLACCSTLRVFLMDLAVSSFCVFDSKKCQFGGCTWWLLSNKIIHFFHSIYVLCWPFQTAVDSYYCVTGWTWQKSKTLTITGMRGTILINVEYMGSSHIQLISILFQSTTVSALVEI